MQNFKINIFQYLDYRKFLTDIFSTFKKKDKNFSHRLFAMKAGFKSSGFFKLVIDGKRNLTEESIYKISKAFALSEPEQDYFKNLVYFNQTADNDAKNIYYQKMINSNGFCKSNKILCEQIEYFTKWYHCVIREIIAIQEGNLSVEQIAKFLEPQITTLEVKESIRLLLSLDLIRKNKNGKYEQTNKILATDPQIASYLVVRFHKEMILNGMKSIDKFEAKDRDITSLTMGISKLKFLQIREKIKECRKEIIKIVNNDTKVETVYQLNFQLFPLVKDSTIKI
ncbi:MAG TPA: TIGR02147 family protein [bacterium]|nr:TIGR02147 family protein [bacterium]HPN30129.1 TIGR02147 family protein [bacterium]